MRFAVVVFPGTWSDHDCYYVLRHLLGQAADLVCHPTADLSSYDCIVLPGARLERCSIRDEVIAAGARLSGYTTGG